MNLGELYNKDHLINIPKIEGNMRNSEVEIINHI
jgi:hypothetical protein